MIVFTSCTQGNTDVAKVATITIKPEDSNKQDISFLIESMELIPLETKEKQSLIGNIHKVKADNNYFYVLDFTSEILKVFSKEGKFINAIGHRGRGPGEYVQIADFFCSNDTINVFAWSGNRKWIRYSTNNKFLYETDMSFPLDDIYKIGDDRYVVYVGNGTVSNECSHYLYCVNQKFKIQSRIQKKTPPYDIHYPNYKEHFSNYLGRTLYLREYCDTIYSVADDLSFKPEYHLDFGSHWYSKEFLKEIYKKSIFEMRDAINKKECALFVHHLENETHIIIDYCINYDNKYCPFMTSYNKNNGKTYNFRETSDNLLVNLLIHPYCVQEGQFVSIIPADIFLDFASEIDCKNTDLQDKIKKCAERVGISDNPIMVKYSLKSE
jgi:hypothetical protein